jgi:hypothetical protein
MGGEKLKVSLRRKYILREPALLLQQHQLLIPN